MLTQKKSKVLDEGKNPRKMNFWTTWHEAVRATVCYAYEKEMFLFGIRVQRCCDHARCDGALEVLERVYCDEDRYKPLYD